MVMEGFSTATDSGQSQGTQNEYLEYILKDEDGNEVTFYSMLEMSFTGNSSVVSEPIEKGSFATYNKVIDPLEATARLALTGEPSEIQNALDGLEELKKGEKKLEFITPFETYENFMLESYDYRRDGNSGQDVLQVDIRLKEVREIETGKTTQAVSEPPPVSAEESKNPSCASTADYVEKQAYSSSPAETTAAAETNGGKKSSILHDIMG
jgi:hypothetical protein